MVSMSRSDKKQRKVIRSEGREIIVKVYHFLKDEYRMMKEINSDNCDLSPLANVRRRTAEATGVSERTVTKFLHEEKVLSNTPLSYPQMAKSKRQSKGFKALGLAIDDIKAYVPPTTNYEEEDIKPSLIEMVDHNPDDDGLKEIKNIKKEISDSDTDEDDCDEEFDFSEIKIKKEEDSNNFILGD